MGKTKRVKIICKQCGKEREVKPSLAKRPFCSRKCCGAWKSENLIGENNPNWRGGNVKKKCARCGKEFETRSSQADTAKFCSWKCKRGRVKKVCAQCGKELEIKLSRADRTNFCSRKCNGLWQSENWCGENHPSWKGGLVKITCEQCGEEFEAKPSASQKFCSVKCMGLWKSENLSGENSHLWKGGKSFEPYGLEFDDKLKEEVRNRDNYTCAISGEVWQLGQYKFHVHHIDYDKKNNVPSNLITLERGCHLKTNGDRDLWQAILEPIAQSREKAYDYSTE